MSIKMPGREAWMMFLTILRFGLGIGLCVAVWHHDSPYISVGWLAAIVICDLGDGVVARWLGVDTTTRRITDVVVDRFSIHSAMAVIILYVPGTLWLTLPVVIRDLVLIVFNWWVLYRKHSIVTPGNLHRTGTFLYAVLYATLLFSRGELAHWVAGIISVIVWILLIDYLRAGILIPSQPKGQPLARYQAIKLRAFRGITPPRKNAIGL
jgi:phosphatidylglycerophosphate synthase